MGAVFVCGKGDIGLEMDFTIHYMLEAAPAWAPVTGRGGS